MNRAGTIGALLILSGVCLLGFIMHMEEKGKASARRRRTIRITPEEAVEQVKNFLSETTPFT